MKASANEICRPTLYQLSGLIRLKIWREHHTVDDVNDAIRCCDVSFDHLRSGYVDFSHFDLYLGVDAGDCRSLGDLHDSVGGHLTWYHMEGKDFSESFLVG